jgi:hypothetical protein
MTQRSRPRRLLPLVVAGVLVGVVVGGVVMGQRALIYLPDRGVLPPAAAVLPGARDVTLTTSDDVALGAWFLPPSGTCHTTVLVAHGNGGNRGHLVGLAKALGERGFGVLLFDYRGYGENRGSPSEAGLARDVRAAREFLAIPGAPIVYLGESLGTGVVSELALTYPPAALVLRSPFTSLADAGRAAYRIPVGWLLRDRYPVRDNVSRLGGPVAVVYGDRDTIVPTAQSRAVARAAREAGADVLEVEVPGASHNDLDLTEGPALVGAVVEVTRRAGVIGCG